MKRLVPESLATVVMIALAVPGPAGAAAGETRLISVSTAGGAGNDDSLRVSVSGDGNVVAFDSFATNLVPDDVVRCGPGTCRDVFVRDRRSDTTTMISVSATGVPGNDHSFSPSVSADGRFVAFTSSATNLVAGDVNDSRDVFVHDVLTGATELVSVSSTGRQGDGDSVIPEISGDGSVVAFKSWATNLVPNDTNRCGANRVIGQCPDDFVHNRLTGETLRVSVATDGTEADDFSDYLDVSHDGRFVAFGSIASNLVPGDTNGTFDVFVRDVLAGTTQRVSVGPGGLQGDDFSWWPAISGDGRLVAFNGAASNIVAGDGNAESDVFVHDRLTRTTRIVSRASDGRQSSGYSARAALSDDGRSVAFWSMWGLVPADLNATMDAYVFDLETGSLTLESVRGCPADGVVDGLSGLAIGEMLSAEEMKPELSADGSVIVFDSSAINLDAADDNREIRDVFARERC